MLLAQGFECRKDIRIELEAAEGVEVTRNGAGVAGNIEVSERLTERQGAYFLVRPIGLPIMGDVSFLPIFPEGTDIDVRSATLAEDGAKSVVGALPHVDEGTENVERKKHGARSWG